MRRRGAGARQRGQRGRRGHAAAQRIQRGDAEGVGDAGRQSAFIDLLLRECAGAGSTLLFVSHDRRLAGHFTREIALAELNTVATGEAV